MGLLAACLCRTLAQVFIIFDIFPSCVSLACALYIHWPFAHDTSLSAESVAHFNCLLEICRTQTGFLSLVLISASDPHGTFRCTHVRCSQPSCFVPLFTDFVKLVRCRKKMCGAKFVSTNSICPSPRSTTSRAWRVRPTSSSRTRWRSWNLKTNHSRKVCKIYHFPQIAPLWLFT